MERVLRSTLALFVDFYFYRFRTEKTICSLNFNIILNDEIVAVTSCKCLSVRFYEDL